MNVCYVGLCVVSCVVVWMVCECVLCGSVRSELCGCVDGV